MNEKKGWIVQYSSLPSSIWPILHSASLPVPTSPEHYEMEIENKESMEEGDLNRSSTSHEPYFEKKGDTPHWLS